LGQVWQIFTHLYKYISFTFFNGKIFEIADGGLDLERSLFERKSKRNFEQRRLPRKEFGASMFIMKKITDS